MAMWKKFDNSVDGRGVIISGEVNVLDESAIL